MHDLAEKDTSQPPVAPAGKRRWIVIKFLAGWFGSILILVFVALLANIEWVRPHLEETLAASFHRKVSLGRLSWSLGLNGLAVATDRFFVVEDSGKPFISSGPSEIGLAFLPLFQQETIVKHLLFKSPEVWAERLPDGKWNFSDLLVEGPEIHLLQVDKGTLHLTNRGRDQSWSEVDLEDIKLKFVFPRKDKETWPVYFSARVTQGDKTSQVKLSLTGRGQFDFWRTQKYSGELELKNFNPHDYLGLMPWLPDVRGEGTFKIAGEGIPDKGINATVNADMKEILFASKQKDSRLPDIKVKGQVLLKPDQIDWTSVELNVDRFRFSTSGQVSKFEDGDPQVKVNIGGDVGDLDNFASLVLAPVFPDAHMARNLTEAADNSKASMSLRVSGHKSALRLSAVMKASGIPFHQVMHATGCKPESLPVKIDPEAMVSGEFALDGAGGHYELQDVQVQVDKTVLNLSGSINSIAGDTEIEFSVRDLPVKTMTSRLTQAELQNVPVKVGSIGFEGAVDLSGRYKTVKQKPQVAVKVVPRNLSFISASHGTLVKDVQGTLTYDGKTTVLDNFSATVPGPEESHGKISGAGKFSPDYMEIRIAGESVDVSVLRNLAGDGGLQLPTMSVTPLRGRLKDFAITCRGRAASPEVVTMTAHPEDVVCEVTSIVKAPSKAVHIIGGAIKMADGTLDITDLTVASRFSKAQVQAVIKGMPKKPELDSLVVNTEGLDIGEWQTFLRPVWLEKASQSLPLFLVPHPGTPLSGKLYGDIKVSMSGKFETEAVLGLNNVAGTFGKNPAKVEKLTGLVTVSPTIIYLQDVAGMLGRSSFTVDGVVDQYDDLKRMSWNGLLRGRFMPEELKRITVLLQAPIKVSSRHDEPTFLRLSGAGNVEGYHVSLSSKLHERLGLKLETEYGTLEQPPRTPVTFDGGISVVHGRETQLRDVRIQAGSDNFKLEGLLGENRVDLNLASVGQVQARTLAGLMFKDPAMEDVTGDAAVDLKISGPMDGLFVHGNIETREVNIPALKVNGMTAKVTIPGWSLAKNPVKETHQMKASAVIEKLNWSELSFHNGHIDLDFEPGPPGRIRIVEGNVGMSGGKVALTGYYEPQSANYRVDLTMNSLAVQDFVRDLMDRDGKVSGSADVTLSLQGVARDTESVVNTLSGAGKFKVIQGQVSSFGKLQEKLNGANLLQQGIFGFNINNLVQTVLPVNNGVFKEIEGEMRIESGVIHLDHVRYEGENLRMRAAGTLDLPKGKVTIDVAGDLPRVSSSIIPGPFGEVSRNFTLQRLFRVVTFKQLKDLPSLPLLGDIANDDPRSFMFKVQGPINEPKLISQSAQKSFQWLPNKPYASAHPVPGM